jgi:hypothetical protein
MLFCPLPPASVPGTVTVALSRSPNSHAPVLGTSICQFEYLTEFSEM